MEKRDERSNHLPNDNEVEEGFKTSKLINKQAAGILYLIESRTRNRRKQATRLLGLSKYSLEHLMPKKWENKWDRPSGTSAVHERHKKLLTLGNLAIISQSLNSSIRDSKWEIKKKGNSKTPGLYQYSAGIETLSPYLELEEWNEAQIDKRASDLSEKAVEIWNNES